MKQKPGIDKTKAPIAEEDLPSFATSDSKKLRPVWLAGVINYLVMVIVVSAISFSVPKEDFRAGGWAKEFVDKVGKVIPAIKKHELLRQKGLRETRWPFIFACMYIWSFVSGFSIALIIKKPFLMYRGESFKKLILTRSGLFLFLISFMLLIVVSPNSRWNITEYAITVFSHGIIIQIVIFYFFFFLMNIKEFYLHITALAGGFHE